MDLEWENKHFFTCLAVVQMLIKLILEDRDCWRNKYIFQTSRGLYLRLPGEGALLIRVLPADLSTYPGRLVLDFALDFRHVKIFTKASLLAQSDHLQHQ